MLKDLAKQYVKGAYHHPMSEHDLEEFAKLVIIKFCSELETNARTINWSYGLDSVVFANKGNIGAKSLKEIKEAYLEYGDNKGNSTGTSGERAQGHNVGDKVSDQNN